jgi:Protein of unknown function (DUF3592)
MRNPLTQREWQNADATVTGCDEQPILSMRGKQSRFLYARNYYSVTFRYEALGRTYNSDFTAYRSYEEGSSFAILFDPADPQRNSRNDPQGDQKNTFLITVICLAAVFLFLLLHAVHA